MAKGIDPAERRLVVAANRGPVSFHNDPSGEPVVTRGPGGLVSVLTQMLRAKPGVWIAAAQSPEEERLAAKGKSAEVKLDRDRYKVRYVSFDATTYRRYYNIVANPMLWFIQHYLWDLGRHPDISENEIVAWREGYVPVNRLFAEAIVDEIGGDGSEHTVILHDYHLYLTAPLVRAAAPKVFLQQFVHIPWVQSDYWRVLPMEIRAAIFEGLLANDIVAFHTQHYVDNFLQGCVDVLDLPIDYANKSVRVGVPTRSRSIRNRCAPPPRRGASPKRSASSCSGGASSCSCASTASTSRRTSSAASRPSTAFSICIPSSRSGSRSWRSVSPHASMSRSTSSTAAA
jgi:trehalose-6-phosphate synthase